VVEGDYDMKAIPVLIKKCRNQVKVVARQCRGPVIGKFRGILDEFATRASVDKALIICDANGVDPTKLIAEMNKRLADRRPYEFPVKPLVIVEELEAWLLADELAIETVVGIKARFPDPEKLADPKATLKSLLSRSGKPYTAEMAKRIAESVRANVLAKRCQSFAEFREAVLRVP